MTLAAQMDWALCIPTLNRADVLFETVKYALAQSVPPKQIIIVDASDDLAASQTSIAELVGPSGIELLHVPAGKRSSAFQRNQAIDLARADVCVFFDDDTFMHPDCAEELLKAYAVSEAIVGVSGTDAPHPDKSAGATLQQKHTGQKTGWIKSLRQTAIAKWLWREVFLMSTFRTFVAYDRASDRFSAEIDVGGLEPIQTMTGYKMTARTDAIRQVRFDDALLAYCPNEDTDASYRLGRLGLIVRAPEARLYHFEAAAGRLKRRRASALFLLNNAYFVRRHSTDLAAHRRAYYLLTARRLLAEFLKDLLSRRWTFPQLRGVLQSLPEVPRILNYSGDTLTEYYEGVQARVLAS